MVGELTPVQIDDLLWLAREDSEINAAHVMNYLIDNCQEQLHSLVTRVVSSMFPQADKSRIDAACSQFVDSLYKTVSHIHRVGLIRKWLNRFSNAETQIPESAMAVQTLLQEALRNAATQGEIPSVKLLVHYVKNLNSADASGLVALDYAQCFADQTNDSRCVDILQQAGAKSSAQNSAVKHKHLLQRILLKLLYLAKMN